MDRDFDDMPGAITKAFGIPRVVDRRPLKDLRCLSPMGALRQAWHVLKGEFVGEDGNIYTKRIDAPAGVTVVPGHKMIALALEHCKHCPAQWDCAEAAVEMSESWGTWGMILDDLRWLQSAREPMVLLAQARRSAMPVQVAVSRARGRS